MTAEEHRAIFFRNESRPRGLRLRIGELFDVVARRYLADLRELDWSDPASRDSKRAAYIGHWAERLQEAKASWV